MPHHPRTSNFSRKTGTLNFYMTVLKFVRVATNFKSSASLCLIYQLNRYITGWIWPWDYRQFCGLLGAGPRNVQPSPNNDDRRQLSLIIRQLM